MKAENVTWSTMNTDTRVDKRSVNDIFCKACRRKLAKTIDHRYVNLNGWDSLATIDLKEKTVTVKCKCGVGQVIRCRGDDHEGDFYVWDDQNIIESCSGESTTDSQGEGQAD